MKAVPVVVRLPRGLSGRDAVQAARGGARRACEGSARLGSAPSLSLLRDAQGAPLPERGWYWSRAHTRGLAAGLVAPHPVGIDVEWLDRPRLGALRAYLGATACASKAELLGLWTAAEAVAKLSGRGVAALSECRVVHAGAGRYDVELGGDGYAVQSTVLERHVIAVARPRDLPPLPRPVEVGGSRA